MMAVPVVVGHLVASGQYWVCTDFPVHSEEATAGRWLPAAGAGGALHLVQLSALQVHES